MVGDTMDMVNKNFSLLQLRQLCPKLNDRKLMSCHDIHVHLLHPGVESSY